MPFHPIYPVNTGICQGCGVTARLSVRDSELPGDGLCSKCAPHYRFADQFLATCLQFGICRPADK